MEVVIFVRDVDGGEWEFPDACRFATEDVTNNLMLMDIDDELIGLWSEGRWSYVGVRSN